MSPSQQRRPSTFVWSTGALLLCSLLGAAYAQEMKPTNEPANITVVVKEYDSGAPVSQARVTVRFAEAHSQLIPNRKPKWISFNSKTDAQGRCTMTGVNRGPVVISVTAPDHQAYGKEENFEKDGEVFEVKLKKPQPLQ